MFKNLFLLLLALFFLITFISCPPPSGSDSSSNGNGNGGGGGDLFDIKIINASHDTIPADFTLDDEATVDFTITLKNNNTDIPAATNVIFPGIIVADEAGLNFGELIFVGTEVISNPDITGLNNGQSRVYTMNNTDISTSGFVGDNFFYAICAITDGGINFIVETDYTNNVLQLNAIPCVGHHPVHDGWGVPTALAGGDASIDAEPLPLFDHWYTSTVADPDTMWYSVTVDTNNTYDIYWDDDWEGSGTYTSDIEVWVYETDGISEYDDEDSAFIIPLTIDPTETTILIEVIPVWADGSFAIGIDEIP